MSDNLYRHQSPSKRTQYYFPYRSAEYYRLTNHSTKPYLSYKKQISQLISNSNRLYVKDRRAMSTSENNQEYSRFRRASSTTSKTADLFSPCYSQITNQTENEYSRYRDSRLSRKNSTSTGSEIKLHEKCRCLNYDNQTTRFPVPDEKVLWSTRYPDYTPVEYTTERILRNQKADPSDPSKIDKFNEIDKKIDRRSFTGVYYVDPVTHRPQNPIGRTGITGRGRLYYWGPNHAGDPVVTRWLREKNGLIVHRRNGRDELKPVLEFVSIQRHDTKEWALPGGMVDPGEHVSETIKREFQEEAIKDGVDKSYIDKLFSNGYKIYENYVDDPRNTDNAWLETVAMNFHDETGELTKNLHLDAGDDAEKVVWCPIDRNLQLYACHKNIIKKVVDRLDAYW